VTVLAKKQLHPCIRPVRAGSPGPDGNPRVFIASSGANVITTDNSDWATNCPEYKVTAVQVEKVMALSEWQNDFNSFTDQQLGLLEKASA